jgi:hypothetical protein
VEFCHKVGLDYVSCSPFRVPIARLAAAQAAIKEDQESPKIEEKVEEVVDNLASRLNLDKDELNEKLDAAKNVVKDAAEKLQSTASVATDELLEFLAAGLKSLKAGWNEAKKTFGDERKDNK